MKKKRVFAVAALAMASLGVIISSKHFSTPLIKADEITDKQNSISQLEQKKQDISNTIAALEKKKSDTMTYVAELDKKLIQLDEEIARLDGEIETLSAQLETTKEELEAAKKKQEDQYNAMKSRIKYNYENGSDNYLSLLFESDSVVDFLNNALYAKEMAEFDQNMYDDYKEAKELVEDKEQQLEKELEELEDLKETQEFEKQSVEKLYEQKKVELDNYNNSINKSQSEIDAYNSQIEQSKNELDSLIKKAQEEAKRKAEEEAKKKAEEEANKHQSNGGSSNGNNGGTSTGNTGSTSSGSISSGGYVWPLPSSHYISSPFGPRVSPTAGASSYHKGVDIAAPSGSTIIAIKGGTVSQAGYNASCGNYVLIDHGNGMLSIYMHASALLVSAGTYVNQGDAIARVGSTGISTGPHLHIAITINGEYVNPLNYVS